MSDTQQTKPPPSDTTSEVAKPSPKKEKRVHVSIEGADPDVMDLDPETLDPDMHYRVFYDSGRRSAVARTLGYQLVKRSEDGPQLLSDDQAGAAEDIIRIGDGVLYECTKERYEERRKRKQALAEARLSTPEGQFRKRARRGGAKVVGKDKSDN